MCPSISDTSGSYQANKSTNQNAHKHTLLEYRVNEVELDEMKPWRETTSEEYELPIESEKMFLSDAVG